MSLFTALWRYLGCQPCYINYCYSEFKAWCETVCLPPDNGCSLPCGQPKPVVSKHFWFLVRRHYNNNNNRIQRRYSRFFTISSQRRELSPTRTLTWHRRNRVQITCNTSSAYHVQHVMLRATWYKGTAQLLSWTNKMKTAQKMTESNPKPNVNQDSSYGQAGLFTSQSVELNNNNNCTERRSLRFLQPPHCATNCLQHVRSSCQEAIVCKSRSTHQVLLPCSMLCAMWYEGTAQIIALHLFQLHFISWNRIYLSFVLLAESLNQGE